MKRSLWNRYMGNENEGWSHISVTANPTGTIFPVSIIMGTKLLLSPNREILHRELEIWFPLPSLHTLYFELRSINRVVYSENQYFTWPYARCAEHGLIKMEVRKQPNQNRDESVWMKEMAWEPEVKVSEWIKALPSIYRVGARFLTFWDFFFQIQTDETTRTS
jgi:hypothetical protein